MAKSVTPAAKHTIVAIKVKFELNSKDGLRRIQFGLEKDTEGDTVTWKINFAMFERAKRTEAYTDALVTLDVEVDSKLNNQANPELEKRMRARGDIPNDAWEYAQSCSIPFWRGWITWTGDMILCCADWHRSTVLGNIYESSMKEIWNGPRYQTYRRRMMCGDVEGLLCQDCKGVD